MADSAFGATQWPAATREPTTFQGWILISTAWTAVAATSLIAPVLPRMTEYFAGVPDAEFLTQISIAVPALFVALFAIAFGWLADRIGRRTILLGAIGLYTVSGIAPVFLDSLQAILISRVGVGIAEAAVLTTGTALLSDYYSGETREKWFALQAASATVMAVIFLVLGGMLGEIGWRAPYLVYALPLVLALFIYRAIPEPTRMRGEHGAGPARRVRVAMPRAHMTRAFLVTFFTSLAFYVVIIQLPFLLTERGYTSPFLIGMAAAAGAATTPIGAGLYGRLGNRPVSLKLALSFALSSLGLAVIASTRDYNFTLVGAAISGLGAGIALPTIMTLTMSGLSQEQRGRGSGIWTTAFFLGQFLSPISFFGLAAIFGGMSNGFFFWACAVGAAALFAAGLAAGQRKLSLA